MAVHDKPGQREPEECSWTAPAPFGNYVLVRRVAVGGMSEVFLARAIGAGRPPPVIIKRLLPSVLDEPQSRAAFATEVRLHKAARHPNVVEVLDSGEVNGEPYLALEYVAGVDAFRLMRRARAEMRPIPPGVAVHIARRLCDALYCVHQLKDESGTHLGVVHRDVTPSNVYLSETGQVKLGDFGIARVLGGDDQGSRALKGKYAYLAPEQVSGESFDHRADLFSLAVVLAELLIGQSLFPGAGQLAVLLAIRDCRIDPLRASAHLLPRGLYSVLERALARSPDRRYGSAAEFGDALHPFEQDLGGQASNELAEWVTWAADSDTLARRIEDALRDGQSVGNGSAHGASRTGSAFRAREHASEPNTVPTPSPTADVRTRAGRELHGLSLASLIELVVTGQVEADDEVAMAGEPFRRLQHVDLLARHLSPRTATTHRLEGPGVPDYVVELSVTPMLEVLGWILARRETGALFADRACQGDSGRLPIAPSSEAEPKRRTSDSAGTPGTRKEIYFEHGKVVLVASSERSELFGEYLVAQGLLQRDELEIALAALSRYDGRLGDTLIGLGLVDAVEVFRAIQNQGRARVADVFRWASGRVSFYRGVSVQHIEFRLDLDIPDLMLAGLEFTETESKLEEAFRGVQDVLFTAVRPPPAHALEVSWPASVLALVGALGSGRTLRQLVDTLRGHKMLPADTLRALTVAMAGGIVERKPS